MQNPSPEMMKIYWAKDGNIFIQPDQSGAEALVVSYLTPHGKFRDLFLNKIKSHTYVASQIFKLTWIKDGWTNIDILNAAPISQLYSIPEWKTLAKHIQDDCEKEYFIGKKSCHSFNYRMSPSTFREDVLKESEAKVALSKEESIDFHASYHKLFPEISQGWWNELEFQVRKTGYLFNLFGYPRYCQGPYNEKTWRELTAFVPQSTVGCITAIALCSIQKFIEENNLSSEWHIRSDKHDSILVEVPEEHRELASSICQTAMEQDLKSPRGEEFKMRSETQWGRNWSKQSKDNPEGMRK